MQTTYNAIVIGATGAVGSALVRELMQSPRCAAVTILTRRPTDMFGGAAGIRKLVQHALDMSRLEEIAQEPATGCHVAFCTMGIGQPSKHTKEELWRVDVEQAAAFGLACRRAGVMHMSLLSSVYAKATARSYYLQVKGQAEQRMQSLGFNRLSIFRPSLLATPTARFGITDRILQRVFPRISWMFPERWHDIRIEELGRAMCRDAERPADDGVKIFHYPDFMTMLRPSPA